MCLPLMQLSIQPLSDKVCHVTHQPHSIGQIQLYWKSLSYVSLLCLLLEHFHGQTFWVLPWQCRRHLSRRDVFFNVTDWKREMNENGKWSIITLFIELQRRECMYVLYIYIYIIYTLAHTSQLLQLILVFCTLHSSSMNLFKIGT